MLLAVPPVESGWRAALDAAPPASAWLELQTDLGLAPRTVEAYGRALADYLAVCVRDGIDPCRAGRSDIARYVRDLMARPHPRRGGSVGIGSGAGLANATLQQRLVAVRLFYDYLVEECICPTNPVGRGRYTVGRGFGGERHRGLIPQFTALPWIPTDAEWCLLLQAARALPLRDRLMLALAYDAALRREELCALATDDLDPAHRTLRIRAETTKNRRGRVVPYSAATGTLLALYLQHRRGITPRRGPLFVSESRRNRGQPITVWTWSKVVRRLADTVGLRRFSTHTLRHLCLTDLARCGWEIHAIAQFAGHRSTSTTLRYIHLSGRDLASRLRDGMSQIHAARVEKLAATAAAEESTR
jgi:integrase/recombinase XerD